MKDVTFHGLRCTAVIRLRMEGLSNGQIRDISGMSPSYDRALLSLRRSQIIWSGAALMQIKRNRTLAEQNCNALEICKT